MGEEQTTLRCRHDPDPDTAYRPGSLKADLRYAQDGPVEAKCLNCRQWIRCENYAPAGLAPQWSLKYPKRSTNEVSGRGAAREATYYAVVDEFSTRQSPAGVLRRVRHDGQQQDEEFGRRLAWGRTGRYRGDPPVSESGDELHEISADEADEIIGRMLKAGSRQK